MDARERLIESTRTLLWERGYDGTSPREIQARAGAGQGSMYHHFQGKSDLALAAIRRTAEELRAEVDRQLGAPGSARSRIAGYLRRGQDVLRGCPIGGLAQDPEIVAAPELQHPLEETLDWLQQRLAEVIAAGQRQGELSAALDPLATAAAIAAVAQGGYVLARAANDPGRFDRAVDGILALLGPPEEPGAVPGSRDPAEGQAEPARK
ncbi:TetR/AcrR family transcriptional regulator [Streptacidiphilus albus]|uniref:TetR/AcrR family transcriptional regulator n=1 Tax=Streptacidiphilus albus TaxID=105425 RepID=UPI0005A86F7D|nr:TetR/AcrR family transcriptional regulator [Streptacidiphilus albus]